MYIAQSKEQRTQFLQTERMTLAEARLEGHRPRMGTARLTNEIERSLVHGILGIIVSTLDSEVISKT